MINTKQIILSNFIYHMKSWGGKYSDWYVGTTSDVKQKLFIDHNVTNETGWIWDKCNNSNIAREIKDYLINLGLDNNKECDDEKSVFIYVYKKSYHTKKSKKSLDFFVKI